MTIDEIIYFPQLFEFHDFFCLGKDGFPFPQHDNPCRAIAGQDLSLQGRKIICPGEGKQQAYEQANKPVAKYEKKFKQDRDSIGIHAGALLLVCL